MERLRSRFARFFNFLRSKRCSASRSAIIFRSTLLQCDPFPFQLHRSPHAPRRCRAMIFGCFGCCLQCSFNARHFSTPTLFCLAPLGRYALRIPSFVVRSLSSIPSGLDRCHFSMVRRVAYSLRKSCSGNSHGGAHAHPQLDCGKIRSVEGAEQDRRRAKSGIRTIKNDCRNLRPAFHPDTNPTPSQSAQRGRLSLEPTN